MPRRFIQGHPDAQLAGPETAVFILSMLVIVLALAVLAGWQFGIESLKSVFPHLTTMKANTAVGLAAAGTAAIMARRQTGAAQAGAVAAAGIVAGLGLLTLAEYWTGTSFGIDQALFADPFSTSPPFNGRMSPATALAFIACGLSLLLLTLGRSSRTAIAAHLVAAVPAAVSSLSLLGYAYGVERLYNFGPYVSLALHTSIGLAMLAVALMLIRHNESWARAFAGKPIARAAFRQILCLSFLVPFVIGLVVVRGQQAGFYQPQFAPTLFALATGASLIALALRSAQVLGKAEAEVRLARELARQHATELESSRRRHLALVEELPQLVWTCLPDGQCNYLSRQWVAYTGESEATQLGLEWLNAIHLDDQERTRIHWLGAVAGSHPYDIEYRLRAGDGSYRWFKTRGTPIRAADGSMGYWFGTCTDIQEIVEARDVLARSRGELEAEIKVRSDELVRVEEQLRQSQKMEAVGQLTGGLAHDFNNMLTGITGSLELAQRRIAQGRVETIGTYLSVAQTAAHRAAALTQRLLAFSRQQTLDPKITDLNRLVSDIEELVRRTVGPGISVEVVAAEELWACLIDPGQMENALLNLCLNGRDAMPDGGRLVIETANCRLDRATAAERELPDGDYVSLSVTDTGIGMAPAVMRRAFDPFFTTKPMGEGTGLGLSMTYGFVRQSSGQLHIESAVGRGTTMRLILPRDHGAPVSRIVPVDGTASDAQAQPGETVLVVDDEPNVRMLIADVLGELQYRVIEAANGAEALKVLQSGTRLDLLITDLGLPGALNGRQVADAARAVRRGLKVLYITGYAEQTVLGSFSLADGMALLNKPFSIQNLTSRLKDLIRPPEPSAGPIAAPRRRGTDAHSIKAPLHADA